MMNIVFQISDVHKHTWYSRGCDEGGQGEHNSPGAKSLWGRRITAGAQASPANVTSTFFNTLNLLPKEFRFEHGDAKLTS